MNKLKRMTKKKAFELRQRKKTANLHFVIAIVALIECLMLISFTTYSWIESSSSLIIKNGRQTTVVADTPENYVNLNISDELDYRVNIPEDLEHATFADINEFFSRVKYYELSKCTSADGKTFFFPRRNNTYTGSDTFRKGDTTDFNTSYYYFDFVVKNNTSAGKDFFFDPDTCFTVDGNKTIFNATDGDATLNSTYTYGGETNTRLEALRRAMRMSVTTQVGNGSSDTTVFSVKGTSGYKSIDPSAGVSAAATDSDLTASVTTQNITNYIYREQNNAVVSTKIFNARRNQETKVSIRIWFDIMDPDFQAAFGFNTTTHSFDTDLFASIPSAKMGINFALMCTNNDFQPVYFDDYTFSNTANKTHLTDEQSGYRMWFYAYQPATTTPQRDAGEVWMKMSKDGSSSAEKNRWITSDATVSMMSSDTTEYPDGGMTSSHIGVAKFVYARDTGGTTPGTILYEWKLPNAPGGDYYFNAYSYTPYSTSSSGTFANSTKVGVGVWDDGDANQMMLVKFRDAATASTDNNFNDTSVASPNFKVMNAKAQSVISNGTAGRYLMFVNHSNESTAANNYTAAVAKTTAAMYYDSVNEEFKSYVPRSWLVGNSAGAYFSYCPDGFYSHYNTASRWFGNAPSLAYDGSTYTFNALGFVGNGYLTEHYKGSAYYHVGVGTWGEYEEIKFSTELIDNTNLATYRYYIGIQGYANNEGFNYYALIPNYDHTSFSAYIPSGVGSEGAGINFIRYSDYKGVSGHNGSINGYWYGNRRYAHTTFYPVKGKVADIGTADSDASTMYTRGYWNLSVLVDGTYENLIYDTLSDSDNIGTLEYSLDGTNWTEIANNATLTFTNKIDRYRFYAPAETSNTGIVYWKWTPYVAGTYTVTENNTTSTVSYDDTVFTYEHDLSTGIYKVITEPVDEVVDQGIPSDHTGDWPIEETEP